MVLRQQRLALLRLIGRRPPLHVEYFVLWPQIVLRRAVARYAERHRESMRLIGHLQVRHVAMATRAADAVFNVNGVVEIDVLGQASDASPVQRRVVDQAVAHGCQHARISPDLRMTGHARVGRWHPGGRSRRYRYVAIAAVDAQFAGVMLVAELRWLRLDGIAAAEPIGMGQALGRDQRRHTAEQEGP